MSPGPLPDNAARNDRVTAVVLFALGLAMLAGGFFMDRLEVRRIHPASIPGLVPMILGAVLALCAVILYRRAGAGTDAVRVPAPPVEHDLGDPGDVSAEPDSWRRLVATALWSVLYALLLVGTLPFAVATAIYVGGFVAGFGWHEAKTGGGRARLLAKATMLAIPAAWAIATLFSEGFLVRLP